MARPRDPEKRRFWEAQLGAWQRSGLTQAEYCRRQGLRRRLFCAWKRRLSGAPQKDASPVRFIPVAIRPDVGTALPDLRVAPNAQLTVVTDGGYRIEVGDGFAPDTLSRLLSTLARR
jgi:hypothetical protein